MNTRRENRLEELGRVDAEKAYTSKGKRNLREEKDRIRSELATGGRAGKPGPKAAGPSGREGQNQRKKFKKKYGSRFPSKEAMRSGGGPDAGNIGKLKDALSKFKKMPTLPKRPDLSKLKERMPKYMKPLRKGGSAKGPHRPRPQGPHMWVRGDKRKKYASGGAVMAGKKVGCQIK